MRLAARMSAVSLAVLATALPAHAGTVSVRITSCDRYYCDREVTYAATPGQSNDVSVVSEAFAVVITDRGAVVTPGEGCTRIDENSARCEYRDCSSCPPEQLFGARVDTGDGDDRISSAAPISVRANAGPGDDDVSLASGRIDGGGGRDRLTITSSVIAADGDDGSPAAPFDSDVITGPGVVDYRTRLQPVAVDLEQGTGGYPGEADQLVGVMGALGGSGRDRLIGTSGANVLVGMGGPDELAGGDGDDTLGGGTGRDLLDGGPGNDKLVPGGTDTYPQGATPSNDGADQVVCGEGLDLVDEVRGDGLAPDCERVWLLNVGIEEFRLTLPLRARSDPFLRIKDYDCPQRGSRLIMTVRSEAGVLLGRRTIVCKKHYGFRSAGLRLSIAGRRALRTSSPLAVLVTGEERNPDLFHRGRFWVERSSFTTQLVDPGRFGLAVQ